MIEREVTLDSDSAAFALRGSLGSLTVSPWSGNSLVRIDPDVDETGTIFVETGNQWGPFSVLVRTLSEPPHRYDDRWEDIVEFSVATTGPLVVSEVSDPYPSAPLATSAGSYRIRVHARGREKRTFTLAAESAMTPDEEQPVEWYLVECWPAPPSDPSVLKMTSRYATTATRLDDPDTFPGAAAAMSAASRIGKDVDGVPGARDLSGDVGGLNLTGEVNGGPDQWITSFAFVLSWSNWWSRSGGWSTRGFDAGKLKPGPSRYGRSNDSIDQLSGRFGAIRTSIIAIDPPNSVVRNWMWVVNRSVGRVPLTEWPELLPAESQLTILLKPTVNAREGANTEVSLHHDRLPVEWIDDMTTWWQFQLEIARRTGLGRF